MQINRFLNERQEYDKVILKQDNHIDIDSPLLGVLDVVLDHLLLNLVLVPVDWEFLLNGGLVLLSYHEFIDGFEFIL